MTVRELLNLHQAIRQQMSRDRWFLDDTDEREIPVKPQKIDHMLNFTYERSAFEICRKVEHKISSVKAKIEEREARMAKIRAEYKITDLMLVDMLQWALTNATNANALVYRTSTVDSDDEVEREVTVGAGVINGLMTERQFIEAERSQIEKLEIIERNLRDITEQEGGVTYSRGHKLTHTELVYLGF